MKSTIQSQNRFSASLHCPLGVVAVLSVVLGLSASVHAAVLVGYNMENTADRTAPSTLDENVAATSLLRNNINVFGALQNVSPNWNITAPSTFAETGTDAASALSVAGYVYLTLTPVSGNAISITSLSFDVYAATGTTTSFRQLYVFSDKTGYASGSELFTGSSAPASANLIPFNTSPPKNFSIDLSGNSSFANITDSITFRLYTQTPTAAQSLAFDNITVNGTVIPVPEPATYAFLGLGFFALLATRCFRRPA